MNAAANLDRLPPKLLPLLYFGFARLCLGTAFLLLATRTETLVGFFYHPAMIAVVHLVTLGWISGSILGAVYLIGPIGLRMRLPAGRMDYVALGLFSLGTAGMVGHFWIDAYNGMLWSAATLLVALAWVMGRVLVGLRSAALPVPVKLHIGFAFLNIMVAGSFGFLVGLEKIAVHVLPGFVFDGVYAHAHLAALGWATMMVVGTGYRLFPMFLPAAMPQGRSIIASAMLLEAGALGLFVGLMLGGRSAGVWSILATAGLFAFFLQIRWMRKHRKQAPKELVRPDYGMGHAVAALGFLAVATILGLVLVTASPAAWKLDVAMIYGVCALVGFLSQLIVGMTARLLPMFAWIHAYAGSGYSTRPPSPYSMPRRHLQLVVLVLWSVGVPALALSLYSTRAIAVAITAWAMLAAVIVETLNGVAVVRHAFPSRNQQ